MKQQNDEKKYAYIYTLLLMVLFTIPVYFALTYAYENELILKEMSLEKYSNDLENQIYSEKINLTRSVKIRYAFLNKMGEEQLYDLSKDLENYDFKTFVDYPYFYYKKHVNKNIYGISTIICETKIDYSKVILLATILFFSVLINIILLNRSIIRNISKPYELVQRYTNILFNDTMHELKTPLGIINLNLDLLVRKNGENKHINRMKIALKQIQINYESIEYYIKNHKVKYSKDKINLSEYLLTRVDFFEDIAKSKFMAIETNIENEVFIYMNLLELQRIIDNTIINAIKYSKPQSKIEVSLKSELDTCFLTIKDYGYGIKDTKSVFQRFTREDQTQGGFGLGLNIIKTICDKNGIEVKLESKEDVGSSFTYEIEIYKEKFLDRLEDGQ